MSNLSSIDFKHTTLLVIFQTIIILGLFTVYGFEIQLWHVLIPKCSVKTFRRAIRWKFKLSGHIFIILNMSRDVLIRFSHTDVKFDLYIRLSVFYFFSYLMSHSIEFKISKDFTNMTNFSFTFWLYPFPHFKLDFSLYKIVLELIKE